MQTAWNPPPASDQSHGFFAEVVRRFRRHTGSTKRRVPPGNKRNKPARWYRWIGVVAASIIVGGPPTAGESISNNNLWLNFAGDHPVAGGPWGIHLETQIRRSDFGGGWQQLLVRPGVNYAINPSWSVSAGYAWVETYPYSDLPVPHEFPENRLWEQVVYTHSGLGLNWTHRVRLEQRFIGIMSYDAGDWDVSDWRYENRIRYLLRMTRKLGTQDRWYAVLWDEVFFNFGSNVSGNEFDQNRVFIGIGYRLTPTTQIETGFMEQTIHRRGGVVWENNHTLAIWLTSRWPFGQ